MSINEFNFIDVCFHSDFSNICYFGFFDLLLGATFLAFNIYGFVKMSKFFEKIKFENMLLLISLFQLILFLIAMICFISILIYLSIFLQIGIICLINYKFIGISKGYIILKYTWINIAIIIINAIYLLVLIILSVLKFHEKYIFFGYYLIELIASIILTIYCCKFLNIILKKMQNKIQIKYSSTIKSKNEKQNNMDKNLNENRENSLALNYNHNEGNELFYIFKKKQLTILYLANIICTIGECSFQICLIFIDSDEIIKLFNFLYFFVFLCHNIIIFLCFYWIIKEQYNKSVNLEKLYTADVDEEGLIDDKFIEEEVMNIEIQKKLKEESKKKKSELENEKIETNEDFE